MTLRGPLSLLLLSGQGQDYGNHQTRAFERRIYFEIAAVVLSFTLVIALAFFSLYRVVHDQRRLISVDNRQVWNAERLRSLASVQAALTPIYLFSGDPQLLRSLSEQSNQFNAMAATLAEAESVSSTRALIAQIQGTARDLRELTMPEIEMRQHGASVKNVNEYFMNNTRATTQTLQGLLDQLVVRENAQLDLARRHFHRTLNWIFALLIGGAALSTILMALTGRLIFKTMRQKRAYDETREALLKQEQHMSQARKEVVEVVSHDLKNPLGTIKMGLQLALEDAGPTGLPWAQSEGLRIALRSVESMERLIHDLLDHTKIEAGGFVLERSPCDLIALATELIKRFESLAKTKCIHLTLKVPKLPLQLACDPVRIEQVLSNLVGNALKFTPERGEVRVCVERSRDEVLMTVEDSGPGIDPEQMPHVFDRFWQVRRNAKEGTGLGLAITKAIVDAHNGRIWVESRRDHGSKFCVRLPL